MGHLVFLTKGVPSFFTYLLKCPQFSGKVVPRSAVNGGKSAEGDAKVNAGRIGTLARSRRTLIETELVFIPGLVRLVKKEIPAPGSAPA
jgi:hypothetical protein